jgi:hypothetical protein
MRWEMPWSVTVYRPLESGNQVRDRVNNEIGTRTEQRLAGNPQLLLALGQRQRLKVLERQTERIARCDPNRERTRGPAFRDSNLRVVYFDNP